MRILFLGDTHSTQRALEKALGEQAPLYRAKLVIQVGDFGFWPPRTQHLLETCTHLCETANIDLYWIDGNHENHAQLNHDAPGPVAIAPRVHYIPRGHLLELDGTRVLFMGGAISLDRIWRQAGTNWFPTERPSTQQWERAHQNGPAHILVTHDSPAGTPLQGIQLPLPARELQSSAQHREKLLTLMQATTPSFLIHGHWHEPLHTHFTHSTGTTQIISLAHNRNPKNNWCVLECQNGEIQLLAGPPDAPLSHTTHPHQENPQHSH